jgi:hypothetical protein
MHMAATTTDARSAGRRSLRAGCCTSATLSPLPTA